ncbi:MAG: hypothetical protein GX410_04830 [Elusimicrobia bacterium]|nr:hypothetical protein [Elusimicrobiota bacterium]
MRLLSRMAAQRRRRRAASSCEADGQNSLTGLKAAHFSGSSPSYKACQ